MSMVRINRRSIFFFNDTASPEIYTLPLHDALPISPPVKSESRRCRRPASASTDSTRSHGAASSRARGSPSRSEEHTSELQSRQYLVCRLLLEKKNDVEAHVRDVFGERDPVAGPTLL